MSFGSRLKQRREELGLKQSELGQMLGITGSAIGNYENDVSSPKAEILYQVFDVLKCDANYLFQDEMNVSETNDFTVSEKFIIKKYRALDEHGKKIVDIVIEEETSRIKKAKQEKIVIKDSNNIIYLPESIQSASAGYGELADDETTDIVSVLYNSTTAKADYIMRVSGDSMEPKFFDGQRVLVRSQPSVEMGEIGIFIKDDMRYIKIYRGDHMESANPKYNPEPFEEYSKCKGKVLGVLKDEWVVD